jgi:amidohydrolase
MKKKNFREEANRIIPDLLDYRRYIHRNPELSFEEFETAKFISQTLDDIGVKNFSLTETGVVGLIGEGDNCVALRADMDALPILEGTGLEFQSEKHGIMHACGHDMHTAMLLGAAKILKKHESKLNGTVKLIFQPGEELIPGGAYQMIKAGVLDYPKPKAIFAQHVHPMSDTGMILTAPGPFTSSADELYWTIIGRSTHAALPHIGSDPIIAASNLIVSLQSLITKYKNPLDPAVLAITSFHGGTSTNIIPEIVDLKGTLRTFDDSWRQKAHKIIEHFSVEICRQFDTECLYKPKMGFPPTLNNERMTALVKETAREVLGVNNFEDTPPMMWAEDFGYYSYKIPATLWLLGVKPPELEEMPSLHNTAFSPDEDALPIGATMLASVASRFLESK